jgi:hypothetical protein
VGDADAGGDQDVLALDVERCPQGQLDVVCNSGGIGFAGDVLEQYGELVAAQASNRVTGSQ